MSEQWSDKNNRRRGSQPAMGRDGHGRPCIINWHGIVTAVEVEPDHWAVTVEGGWGNMLDAAEAIISADREMRRKPCHECAGDHHGDCVALNPIEGECHCACRAEPGDQS
jgi:hypothetical protein